MGVGCRWDASALCFSVTSEKGRNSLNAVIQIIVISSANAPKNPFPGTGILLASNETSFYSLIHFIIKENIPINLSYMHALNEFIHDSDLMDEVSQGSESPHHSNKEYPTGVTKEEELAEKSL